MEYLETTGFQVAYMKQDHLKTLGPYFVPRHNLAQEISKVLI